MLQRNAGPYPLDLPTLDPPRTVAPGEELDHPDLIAGFEPVPARTPRRRAAAADVPSPDPLPGATPSAQEA